MKEDKRKAPRVDLDLLTQVEILPERTSVLARMENLSEGGMFLKIASRAELAKRVYVRFNLPPVPPGTPVEAEGKVMFSGPDDGMGIQFLDMKDAQSQAIAQFVKKSRS